MAGNTCEGREFHRCEFLELWRKLDNHEKGVIHKNYISRSPSYALASLRDPPPETKSHVVSPKNGPKLNDENFLKDVDEATRRVIEKEQRHEQYKANFNKGNKDIQLKKLVSEIEKRDFEIQALRLEVESLRKQMQEVKSRNKKLCEVISCSEMRSKGELVVELEKVSRGREEFSEEVTLLNGQLEQERTKVSQLTNELKKMQGKKRNADSTSK